MGCASSTPAKGAEPPSLLNGRPQGAKRLSVSIGDKVELPDDRELDFAHNTSTVINTQDLLGWLDNRGSPEEDDNSPIEIDFKRNRRGSLVLGSTLDDNVLEHFKDKNIKSDGDASMMDHSRIAHLCRKGLKPDSPNQDSYCILMAPDFSIYGVFDGHGKHGHLVSNHAKEQMPKAILKDPQFPDVSRRADVLKNAFLKTHERISNAARRNEFDAKLAGTTATVVLHDHGNSKLHIAHVGDSRCSLGKWAIVDGVRQEIKAVPLTQDHKPNDPEEKKRIISRGGAVTFDGYANHRVYAKGQQYPGMAMSRALGDLLGHKDAGITAEPTVSEIDITEDDRLLLLCSDGVWEFISDQEAMEIFTSCPTAKEGVDLLVQTAWDRWMKEEKGQVVDDITAIAICLQGVDERSI